MWKLIFEVCVCVNFGCGGCDFFGWEKVIIIINNYIDNNLIEIFIDVLNVFKFMFCIIVRSKLKKCY